jgi:hypothetical protein
MTLLKVVDNLPLPRLADADMRAMDLKRQQRDPDLCGLRLHPSSKTSRLNCARSR